MAYGLLRFPCWSWCTRTPFAKHAPSIRLGDVDSSIVAALSLESHRHLRTSIIDSIVGEFPAVILTVSFWRDPILLLLVSFPHTSPSPGPTGLEIVTIHPIITSSEGVGWFELEECSKTLSLRVL
jgi:hypothetical protein